MLLLCAVRDVYHFGASHFVSEPHPGLSHAKPESLVSIGFRGARHRHTLLNQMLVNSDLHCIAPFMLTCPSMSSGVRQRFDPHMAECGRHTENHWSRRNRLRLLYARLAVSSILLSFLSQSRPHSQCFASNGRARAPISDRQNVSSRVSSALCFHNHAHRSSSVTQSGV